MVPSANLAQDITNARVPFLVGLTTVPVLGFLFPKALKRFDKTAALALVATSIVATYFFCLLPTLSNAHTDYLVLLCLYVIGVGYGWVSLHLLSEISHEANFATVVYLITAGLLLKTIITSLLSSFASYPAQMAIAVIAPIIAIGAVIFGQRQLDRSAHTLDLMELPKVKDPDRRVLIVLLLLSPALRAMIRALSKMGFWGSGFEAQNLVTDLGFLIVTGLLVFFAWLTLVKQQSDNLITRFMPAFLVILGGFFLLDPGVATLLGMSEWVNYILTTFIELYSHVFYWSLIALSVRSLDLHPYKVIGLALTAYGISSLVFSLLMQSFASLNSVLIIVAMYCFICALMLIFRNGSERTPVPQNSDKQEDTVDENQRLLEIAQAYGLSPRETEVFVLLMQGRNRTYIKDSLFLAEGTVKTHITRIYQKLGVNNRQDMITLIQDSTAH